MAPSCRKEDMKVYFGLLCIVMALLILPQFLFSLDVIDLVYNMTSGKFTSAFLTSSKGWSVFRDGGQRFRENWILLKKNDSVQDAAEVTVIKKVGVTELLMSDVTVAVGCAITTRKQKGSFTAGNINQLPFFSTLLPSFCKTASTAYHYHFYIAHDHNDEFFAKNNSHDLFHKEFRKVSKRICDARKITSIYLHLVECDHTRSPARAQNDAMLAAYLDNMEYYYRINDDTHMTSSKWTETFIHNLKEYQPPLVGVVGPTHSHGNTAILTHDFVHKTHLDIFGFYYPRIFIDWFADDWITKVYLPGRSTKVKVISVIHKTFLVGTRYSPHKKDSSLLKGQLDADRATLDRYIKSRSVAHAPDSRKVISMALYSDQPRHVYGVIRNAILRAMYFPEWELRVYVEHRSVPSHRDQFTAIDKAVEKLLELNCEIALVNTTLLNIPSSMWRLLILDDKSVDYFLVRNSDNRLGAKDAKLVNKWMDSGGAFLNIEDLVRPERNISGGLWGGRAGLVSNLLRKASSEQVTPFRDYCGADVCADEVTFLESVIWPKVRHLAYYHEQRIPLTSNYTDYMGQIYDQHENALHFFNT